MEAAQCAHHYYNTFVEAMHWRLFLLTYESNWNWERSNFQGIQINFAPPRPAGFANFRGAGRGGARLAFLRGGAGQPFFRGAGRGAHPWYTYLPCSSSFLLREGINGIKSFSFGHCLNDGGGVYPCPNFLALFLEVQFWSIKRVYFFKNANVLNF